MAHVAGSEGEPLRPSTCDADEEEHQAGERRVGPVEPLARAAPDELGHLRSALAHRHHAAEVIVHRPADDAADRYRDEGGRPEENALDRPENGTRAGDVQQVDEGVAPFRHGDVVHPVGLLDCRRGAVVWAERPLAEPPVQGSAYEQESQARNERRHRHLP